MSANTPSAYKPEYCELIKELMKGGGSFAVFRAHVGIAKSTFFFWRKQHPEFDEACDVANAISTVWWETQAHAAAGITGSKGAPAIILAGLYNRGTGDWSNKQEVETTVKEENKIDLSKLTDEELKAYELVVAARQRISGGTEQA